VVPVAGAVLIEGAVGAVAVVWVWVTAEVEAKVVVAMRGKDVILDTFGVASGVNRIAKRRSSSSGSAGFSESEPEVVGSGVEAACSTGSGSVTSGLIDTVGIRMS